MEESILVTIKKLLGLDVDYTPFDTDLIVLINSALMTLNQAAIGPKSGFRITGMSENWSDFLTNRVLVEGAKEYVYLRVKIIFDPPSSGTVMEAIKSTTQEVLWRLIAQAESAENFDFVADSSSGSGSGSSGSSGNSEDGGSAPIPSYGTGPHRFIGPEHEVYVGAAPDWSDPETSGGDS